MENEEDIQPAFLPEEVMDFIDRIRETIAESTGVDVETVIFKGFVMHFDSGGKDITFQGMKIV